MHHAMRIIVQAEDKEEALAEAESTAEDMVESGDFDYYRTGGQWGKSEAHELSSKHGQELVTEGMKYTRDEFDDAMRHIRYMLDTFSDDKIYSEQFKPPEGQRLPEGIYHLSRWQLHRASGGTHSCYIYGSNAIWGGPIENDRELKEATASKADLWVVLVDFHA